MMDKTKECPKCKGEMKEGNFTGQVVEWEKDGDRSFLKDEQSKIVTYACEKCGFIESYVTKRFEKI
jgi:predicted nucleic-acid-binding Zn-ribbon protein